MRGSIYDNFAHEFDKTRHTKWPGVVSFLNSIPPQSTILDVGCGNGKYLSVRKADCVMHACDTSIELVNIARERHGHAHIIEANGSALPYKDASFDAIICVAVLHHIATKKERIKFVNELMRVLKPNGQLLITVWATQAKKDSWVQTIDTNMYMVPWRCKYTRFYYLFDLEEARNIFGPSCSEIHFECNNWYIQTTKT